MTQKYTMLERFFGFVYRKIGLVPTIEVDDLDFYSRAGRREKFIEQRERLRDLYGV